MDFQDLAAPAKLNLFLHIVGRRPDGYHLLQSVFVLTDLADRICIEPIASGKLERAGDVVGNLADDLCLKAAHCLAQATGCTQGAYIHLKKSIPAGAGLGGGSSDAATTLLALNRLWHLNLGKDALLTIATRIGADVPFFVFGENAFVEGIGEHLTPIAVPPAELIIAMPENPTETKRIFTDSALRRDTPPIQAEAFLSHTRHHWPALFGRNDMQEVAERLNPQITEVRQMLGADSRMTGSGSAVFRLFSSALERDAVRARLPATLRNFSSKILPRHPLNADIVG